MEEVSTVNQRALNFLRKNTILGPIALYKISCARDYALECRDWYYKVENELLSVDYSLADEIEYKLRFKVFERSIYGSWLNNGKNIELSKYAESIIAKYLDKEVENENTRAIK